MNSFKNYTSLGFNNPYYVNEEKLNFENSFSEILEVFNGEIKIDLSAVNQVLSLNFILGNRTLIKNIHKSPWMAKPNQNQTDFEFYTIQKHKEIDFDEKAIAQRLYTLLRDEVKSYVGSSKRIGILLSGGMDSRIVACVLNDLLIDKEIEVESVTGYTWGNLNSRDVVYSKRICEKLGWNFKHYLVTAENLWQNIKIAAENGCEYSGLHLHAIPQILDDLDVEVMLAGSFGDSIGRAEYSRKKVVALKSLLKRRKNFAYLLDYKTYRQTKQDWQEDLSYYHQKYPEDKNYQQLELDYQLHYMRRMLNPCIGLLNKNCNVYQVFTAPEVFQYIWTINPENRTDDVYTHLLKLFKTELTDVPWARTGLLYGSKEGIPDIFKKKHHSYSDYIQKNLIHKMEAEILSGHVFNYLNKDSVLTIFKMIKKYPNNNFDYLERVTWMTSFSLFLNENSSRIEKCDPMSKVSFVKSKLLLSIEYYFLNRYRKLK